MPDVTLSRAGSIGRPARWVCVHSGTACGPGVEEEAAEGARGRPGRRRRAGRQETARGRGPAGGAARRGSVGRARARTPPRGREGAAGQVSLQEVPRSADHNPQRTFFLWHVEWPKVLA